MPKIQFNASMEDSEDIGEVSVVDVYDIASEIGKECEKIIDQFGAEAVTSLMPKVINALELLENLATKNERENTQMQELRSKIVQLENDKIEKAEYRQRFEKELESIEEQWRVESRELVSVVSKLQDENRRLVKVQGSLQGVELPAHDSSSDSNIMLLRLQTVIDKQREELRGKERGLQDKLTDVETELESIEEQWRVESRELVSVVSKLQDENRRLVKVQGSLQGVELPSHDSSSDSNIMLLRLQTVIDKQREELRGKERGLQDKLTDIENLKMQVERVTGSNRDLRRKHRSLQTQVRTLCDERADFLVQLQDQQRNIGALRQRLGLAQKENEDLAKSDSEAPNLTNKVVYDVDDPNRPRFTTTELKDILHERNELKARVSDLEDELDTYRPKNKADTPVEEDAPVQGPLPYEPDDAPWKKSESGIRKLRGGLCEECEDAQRPSISSKPPSQAKTLT